MYLLDTNIVSELRKVRLGKADSGVAAWSEEVDAGDLYISADTSMIEIGLPALGRRKILDRKSVILSPTSMPENMKL